MRRIGAILEEFYGQGEDLPQQHRRPDEEHEGPRRGHPQPRSERLPAVHARPGRAIQPPRARGQPELGGAGGLPGRRRAPPGGGEPDRRLRRHRRAHQALRGVRLDAGVAAQPRHRPGRRGGKLDHEVRGRANGVRRLPRPQGRGLRPVLQGLGDGRPQGGRARRRARHGIQGRRAPAHQHRPAGDPEPRVPAHHAQGRRGDVGRQRRRAGGARHLAGAHLPVPAGRQGQQQADRGGAGEVLPGRGPAPRLRQEPGLAGQLLQPGPHRERVRRAPGEPGPELGRVLAPREPHRPAGAGGELHAHGRAGPAREQPRAHGLAGRNGRVAGLPVGDEGVPRGRHGQGSGVDRPLDEPLAERAAVLRQGQVRLQPAGPAHHLRTRGVRHRVRRPVLRAVPVQRLARGAGGGPLPRRHALPAEDPVGEPLPGHECPPHPLAPVLVQGRGGHDPQGRGGPPPPGRGRQRVLPGQAHQGQEQEGLQGRRQRPPGDQAHPHRQGRRRKLGLLVPATTTYPA